MGPAPTVAAVRSAVRAGWADLPAAGRVLVACSGGPDSLALAAAAAFEAPRAGRPAGLVTVDHGLQPGSARQAAAVAALGHELGLDPVVVLPVAVGTSGGPEGAARAARYGALEATGAALDATLLLGHTLDDQAETVLLGLGRGSGPRSLSGMPARTGRYVRPLLGLRRSVTEAACAALGLPAWRDPHNDDRAYARVRVRHDVLPRLEDAVQGGVAEALARTADLLRDDLDALDAWADAAYRQVISSPAGPQRRACERDDHQEGVDVAALVDLPRAVRTRVLRRWAHSAGARPLSAERTAALDALLTHWHGQGPVELPGAVAVRRSSGRLVASRPPAAQETRVDE